MSRVHVFCSLGRFRDSAELSAFIDQTYTEDGDGVPSTFMLEVGLEEYEPAAIEAVHREQAADLTQLLAEASYADQWLSKLPKTPLADVAICVFEPNVLEHPQHSSLHYVGAFEYQEILSEWFRRTFLDKPQG